MLNPVGLKKPDSCHGCPLYGDGYGFVPDDIKPNSRVMVVMQNPGEQEEAAGVPAIGPSGEYLNTTFLPLAGLVRGNTSVGNVLKCRWTDPRTGEKTNKLPEDTGVAQDGIVNLKGGKAAQRAAINQCVNAHLAIPKSVQLIVTLGRVAWNTLAPGHESLDDWRGFLASTSYDDRPVFGTFHPAYLMHQPRMSIPVMQDWQRVKRILKGEWPQSVPIALEVSRLSDVVVPPGTAYMSLDLEFGTAITLLGIAFFTASGHVVGGIQMTGGLLYHGANRDRLRQWAQEYPFIIFNASADLEVLDRELGMPSTAFKDIIDPIQYHHLFHSEWPHDLGFCESLYGRHHRMKHLSETDFWLYNWGDCLTSGYTYFALQQQLHKDPAVEAIYRTQNGPLIHVRVASKRHGVSLDTEFLADTANELGKIVKTAVDFAAGYGGLNIASHKQVTDYLVKVERMKLPKSRETSQYQIDKDVLAELRRKYIGVDPDTERHGITLEQFLLNLEDGGHPILEARAAYQGAAQLKTHFIHTLLKPGVDTEQTVYTSDMFLDRCYPDQHTHTQASGRWSTVEPPLPTLPKRLRKMVKADPGYVLVKFDWDQEELRLNAHLAQDTPTLEWFAAKYDIHTLNVCDIFEWTYPPDMRDPHTSEVSVAWRTDHRWEGKDDKRRVFAKRFVYRIIYRGDAASAGDIPGAKTLGLDSKGLTEASKAYLSRHPALTRYWQQVDSLILKTRTARTFTGRKRFLSGESTKSRPGVVPPICREGTNHPMQGGGVDVFNLTLLKIWQSCQDLKPQWLYGAHDSQNWQVPEGYAEEFRSRVTEITNQPWTVEGRPLLLPVSFD